MIIGRKGAPVLPGKNPKRPWEWLRTFAHALNDNHDMA
jgi:hypothetical protein